MSIVVNIVDQQTHLKYHMRINEQACISELLPAIVVQLDLPRVDSAGGSIIYHLSYSGRLLQNTETFTSALVQEEDTLLLIRSTSPAKSNYQEWMQSPGTSNQRTKNIRPQAPGTPAGQKTETRLETPGGQRKEIEILICYAHEDERMRQGLEKQLLILQRQKVVKLWHDHQISPGSDWEQNIDHHLNSAHIILLLVSADFMASDYCYGVEMKRALERHESGEACVIPVILSFVNWQSTPLGKLQVLPREGKPVTGWRKRDEAFFNIAEGIRKAVEELAYK